MKVLDALFTSPMFRRCDFVNLCELEPKSAYRILAELKSDGILQTMQEHSGRASEVLVFPDLYQLVR